MRQAQKFDWSAVSKGGPEPLADGLYRARISKAEVQDTKAKDKKMISLTLEIFEDERGEKMSRTVFDRLVFTQKALFRVGILHDALGMPEGERPESDDDDTLKSYAKAVQAASAQGVWVRLKQESYTDQKSGEERVRNAVDRYLSDQAVREAASDSSNGIAKEETVTIRRRGQGAAAQAS